MPKKTPNKADNPLLVLVKILANALLDDPHGVNVTAKNALLILADLVQPETAQELEKKIVRDADNRYKYEEQ
jgi:hypothetical protein